MQQISSNQPRAVSGAQSPMEQQGQVPTGQQGYAPTGQQALTGIKELWKAAHLTISVAQNTASHSADILR